MTELPEGVQDMLGLWLAMLPDGELQAEFSIEDREDGRRVLVVELAVELNAATPH